MPTSVEPVRLEVTARNARPTLVRRCNTAKSPRTAIIVNVMPTLSCHSRAPPISQRSSTVCGNGEPRNIVRPPHCLRTNAPKSRYKPSVAPTAATGSALIGRIMTRSVNAPINIEITIAPRIAPHTGHAAPTRSVLDENFIYGLGPVANTKAIYVENIANCPWARFNTPVDRKTIEIATAKAA